MARTRRFHFPGCISHIIARGIDGCPIFRDHDDYREFHQRLTRAFTRTEYYCIAWALMPNHYHLVVRINDEPMSRFIRPLNGGYARWFNDKYARRGYLFQDRFKSVLCQDQLYARELIRYVHLNPLRAGLISGLEGLAEYPWTGHSMLMGTAESGKWMNSQEVLRRFGTSVAKARASYLAYLQEGIDSGDSLDEAAYESMCTRVGGERGEPAVESLPQVLGNPDWARAALEAHDKAIDQTILLKSQGWTVERVRDVVAKALNIAPDMIMRSGRGNSRSQARAIVAFLANRRLGISTTQIGSFLGISQSAVSQSLCRGESGARELGIQLSA